MFQSIAKQMKNSISNADRIAAARWYADQAKNINKDAFDPEFHMANALPFQNVGNLNVNSIGKLYSFIYDPKYKDQPKILPYYDTFPVVFPIEFYPSTKSGPAMLGINLHYLSPYHRGRLMNALYLNAETNQFLDKKKKLNISYQILKGASGMDLFKPCIKKYLFSHVRSSYMNYNYQVWDYVCQLPMCRFERQTQETIWMESLLKANK